MMLVAEMKQFKIAYHTKMGFEIEDGERIVDGLSINTDYDGQKQDRVLFIKNLD